MVVLYLDAMDRGSSNFPLAAWGLYMLGLSLASVELMTWLVGAMRSRESASMAVD